MGNSQGQPTDIAVDSGNVDRTSTSMTRSHSIRADAHQMAKSQDENKIRYLPRGLDEAHNGIRMPSKPYGGFMMGAIGSVEQSNTGSMDNDYEQSPQWGFFVRTTPPTPQMYYPRPPSRHNTGGSQGSTASSLSSTSTLPTSMPPPSSTQPNPVFQGLQEKNRNTPVAWSGVPL